jgi:hypothetical protein
MCKTNVDIPPRLQNDIPVCNVKKKDSHDNLIDEEIQYQRLLPYLLERHIHPMPMVNTEKGERVTVKSWMCMQKKPLMMADKD